MCGRRGDQKLLNIQRQYRIHVITLNPRIKLLHASEMNKSKRRRKICHGLAFIEIGNQNEPLNRGIVPIGRGETYRS